LEFLLFRVSTLRGLYQIAVLLVIVIVVGGSLGGVAAYQHFHQATVNVYSLEDISMTSYWGDQTESDGSVTANDLQTVYLSDTQVLSEILVTEGQEVKAGDPLFTYDSTLTQLDLDRADLALQQKQLDLETAQKELATIKTYRAGVAIPGSSTWISYGSDADDTSTDDEEITYTLSPVSGTGCSDDPFIYDWSAVNDFNGGAFDDATLAELAQGVADAYVVLRLPSDGGSEEPDETETPEPTETTEPSESPEPTETEEPEPTETEPDETETVAAETNASRTSYRAVPKNAAGASVLRMQIQNTDGAYTYTILSITVNGQEVSLSDALPAPEDEEEPEESESTGSATGYYDGGITYTAAELAQMISKKEQEIKALELEIRESELNLKKLQEEADNDTVYSNLDGTVVLLNDPDAIDTTQEPLVKVSADGSYTVTAALGEMDIGNVSVGQQVDVYIYGNNVVTTTGVIIEISEYPTTDVSYYYNGGNTNISYYPFTVEIDGSENLEEWAYAEIYYNWETEVDSDSIYVDNSFVRSENGKSYVYLYQEDGTLKKQYVSTGKDLWGSYTEIKSGLTIDDYIAFPYGTNVKDGAAAVIADISELYDSMYY
ncbi:MAG: HlyD family efflux transporter periplasmic adaptor subunit, partial [Oscillospiraceae bacterium]|nr:HlyD family efflux transporter periplasmic adaptor subunit [Oscillospiraceae bacterium]